MPVLITTVRSFSKIVSACWNVTWKRKRLLIHKYIALRMECRNGRIVNNSRWLWSNWLHLGSSYLFRINTSPLLAFVRRWWKRENGHRGDRGTRTRICGYGTQ